MIKLTRLDERLIHGQVAAKLLKSLDVDTVVVVDDKSALDENSARVLKMAVVGAGLGGKIKTSVKTLETAIRLLNDPRCEPKKIFIVTRKISDLKALAENVPGINEVNIGNYGNLTKSEKQRKVIRQNLNMNEDEIQLMKEIVKLNSNVYFQLTPDSAKIEMASII